MGAVDAGAGEGDSTAAAASEEGGCWFMDSSRCSIREVMRTTCSSISASRCAAIAARSAVVAVHRASYSSGNMRCRVLSSSRDTPAAIRCDSHQVAAMSAMSSRYFQLWRRPGCPWLRWMDTAVGCLWVWLVHASCVCCIQLVFAAALTKCGAPRSHDGFPAQRAPHTHAAPAGCTPLLQAKLAKLVATTCMARRWWSSLGVSCSATAWLRAARLTPFR